MLDHGKNRPVRAVSLILGRDIAPPKWPCRLSILGLAWLLLSSNAPIWVLCSSQQPVQRGGISPPGYGEPMKAQHHGETSHPQQSECTLVSDLEVWYGCGRTMLGETTILFTAPCTTESMFTTCLISNQ